MSLGGSARYLKGPWMVSRSCVPMATNCRRLQRFWCSLSWRSMNESYDSCVNLTLRSTAHAKYGRIFAVYSVRAKGQPSSQQPPMSQTDLRLYSGSEQVGFATRREGELVLRRLVELKENSQRTGDAFDAEEVISTYASSAGAQGMLS